MRSKYRSKNESIIASPRTFYKKIFVKDFYNRRFLRSNTGDKIGDFDQ